ncbi:MULTISPECIES: ATP-binding protein [Sorangium]|uniref:ATPase AAA n=1 Tax=Sorangium cellulosum TaxID=56 RepID=A0A4P2QIZ4_SORCE|nr:MULTISPECIES: ATP-binding protein [Sorangium]AUX29618.1 ATPase AAA [Sorangium cellulosum]WCQ89012.1 IS21 family transposase ISChy4 [Sorangium sp. Soce836]
MTDLTPTETKDRLKSLGLFGLLACWEQLADKPWLREVLAIEERERHKRSLERRLKNSRVAAFKPMADFDWSWPKKIDREAVDDLFGLGFLTTGHNAVLVGPNGVGKTMILKNLAHQAVVRGHTVRFSTASDMLSDLAAQESSAALARRLRRYTIPALLCIDEVGYLSYDSRYADLLFEVVTRRYDAQKPLLLSTNKAFADWGQVFPHAACVVTLVDRLVHRAEVIEIEAESYRLKEAKELSATRTKQRRSKKH